MQGLQGGEDAMVRLDQLESMYYELQLQLYEIQFEILKNEELLLTAQLQSLRRQMSGERQVSFIHIAALLTIQIVSKQLYSIKIPSVTIVTIKKVFI